MSLDENTIREAADAACSAVFSNYGVKLERQEVARDPSEPLHSAGLVGYYGKSIRGVCVVAATPQPFIRTAPSGLDKSRLGEWVAEVANELGGRIKNRLVAEGLAVTMSLPVVLDGEYLAGVGQRRHHPIAYLSKDGSVFVWIDLLIGEDATLAGGATDPLPEGFVELWGDFGD